MSKIAGIQLTKGNSDIVDLSDVNRPTKLAEKWSSLYTDEWTEAYDQLSLIFSIKNEDCKIEKELCNIAMVPTNDCYFFLSKNIPFSSPDPKGRVRYCHHLVWSSSANFYIFIFFSETFGSIETKLGRNVYWIVF